ncbi:acyl carrier protein [Chakrabartyella piscis]|uniref:acyl carrier protein n=1 Tax=Chakrabartyella piscis TaxID=2918914 RepID=UPI0029587199|nr:acyl carrier protein [Chakrabartyella piscis]
MDENKVLEIIAEQLSVEIGVLSVETVFADLGADSLDLFQIISALEEEFDMEFENEDAENIKTIGDAIAHIQKAVEA